MLLEEVELEEKTSTELPKPEVMSQEEVELDNDVYQFHSFSNQ
jgi:hypothetical protein